MSELHLLRRTSVYFFFFFFSSRRRHTRLQGDWSSDVCSSDLAGCLVARGAPASSAGLLGAKARHARRARLRLGAHTGAGLVPLGHGGTLEAPVLARVAVGRRHGAVRIEIGRASCRERV